MQKTKKSVPILLFVLLAAGCQSPQPVDYVGLDSRTMLRPNTADDTGRIPYSYDSHTSLSAYRKVIVEPVIVYRGPDNQFGDMSDGDKSVLATYAQSKFTSSLSRKFDVVTVPSKDTLTVRVTLTGAKAGKPVIGAVTKVDLVGGPYNAVQALRGKEGMMSGTVSYAVEVYDATTKKLLKAYVAKQYPSAINLKTGWTALDASMVGIEKASEELSDMLN